MFEVAEEGITRCIRDGLLLFYDTVNDATDGRLKLHLVKGGGARDVATLWGGRGEV